MNDRDIRVVDNMFQSGMDRETVLSLFPQFPREEIEKIGERIGKIEKPEDDENTSVSINCSFLESCFMPKILL